VTWLIQFKCVPCLIHMCAVTHLRVLHDSFICVPWLLHMCAMTRSICHYQTYESKYHITNKPSTCEPWHSMTSHMCHDSFTCVPWLVQFVLVKPTNLDTTSQMTHLHVSHDIQWLHMCVKFFCVRVCVSSFICAPWLIETCAVTHSYMRHDSLIRVPWLNHVCAMPYFIHYVKLMNTKSTISIHTYAHLPYEFTYIPIYHINSHHMNMRIYVINPHICQFTISIHIYAHLPYEFTQYEYAHLPYQFTYMPIYHINSHICAFTIWIHTIWICAFTISIHIHGHSPHEFKPYEYAQSPCAFTPYGS